MPPKALFGNRAWGTRFDTLLTSPPPDTAPTSHSASPQTLGTSSNLLLHPPTFLSPAKKDDRISHDASVFVGSLPPDVDHAQISQKLTEYLSAYSEINKVKVVRDSRGGTCAFVQCKNSDSAGQLISTLCDHPPGPFMGRHLRFEQARSVRTLLLSYRAPVHIHSNRLSISGAPSTAATVLDVEPAKAMKLCRRQGSKYITVLYNAEACQSDEGLGDGPIQSTGGALQQLFAAAPLQYDAQTMHALASAFGPLEYFKPYQRREAADGNMHGFCPPHDADRAPGMNEGCWEVKWEHRDDCMAALMTLRTVPHLSVSWAHTAGSRSGRSHYDLGPRSPFSTPERREHCSTAGTPIHWPSQLGQSGTRGPHIQPVQLAPIRFAMESGADANSAGVEGGSSSSPRLPASPDSGKASGSSVDTLLDESDGVAEDSEWSVVPPHTKHSSSMPTSPTTFRSPHNPRSALPTLSAHEATFLSTVSAEDAEQHVGRGKEGDFPPLSDCRRGVHYPLVNKESTADSMDSTVSDAEASNCFNDGDETPDLIAPARPPDFSMHPLNVALEAMSIEREATLEEPVLLTPDAGSEVATPTAPGFGYSRIFDTVQVEGEDDTSLTHRGDFTADTVQKRFDPTTIFVGGMEMYGPNAWDESRVNAVFGQYGLIEGVKFIRPVHKKSAFAFVKYRDTHSSSRAVLMEHNRVYEGRQIRVQIRENHPPRTFFRFNGNDRGRYQHQRQRTFRPDFQFHGRVGAMQPLNHEFVERPIQMRGPTRTDGSDVFSVQSSSSPVGSRPQTALHNPDPSLASQMSNPGSSDVSHTPSYPMAPMSSQSTAAYHANNSGYFVPNPWLTHSYQFPMHAAPTYTTGPVVSGTHDGTCPSTVTPTAYHWQQYMPYHAYPVMAPPMPNNDKSQANQGAEGDGKPQAPLAPTGFTHGEHGYTPIYAPEALTQYMASATSTPSQLTISDQAATASVASFTATAPGSWPAYTYAYPPVSSQIPQTMRGYPMANQMPMGWYPPPIAFPMSAVAPLHAPAAFIPAPQVSTQTNMNAMFQGGSLLPSGGGAHAPRLNAHFGTPERYRSRPGRESYVEVNGLTMVPRRETASPTPSRQRGGQGATTEAGSYLGHAAHMPQSISSPGRIQIAGSRDV